LTNFIRRRENDPSCVSASSSDVHANIEGADGDPQALETRGVDQYVCLGDIIGYGADPEPCIRAIRRVAAHTVVGNHDAAGSGA
jgi:predicted phosphodiesterase